MYARHIWDILGLDKDVFFCFSFHFKQQEQNSPTCPQPNKID